MSKFMVGDKVTRHHEAGVWGGCKPGEVYTVKTASAWSLAFVEKPSHTHDPVSCKLVSTSAQGQAGGLKFDAGKEQWDLLLSVKGMLAAVRGVVGVLMFGAKKYAAHSWREVEDNERRYLDGLMRHYVAIKLHGLQAKDEESGLFHIDHLNCNGLFLGELARKDKDAKQT